MLIYKTPWKPVTQVTVLQFPGYDIHKCSPNIPCRQEQKLKPLTMHSLQVYSQPTLRSGQRSYLSTRRRVRAQVPIMWLCINVPRTQFLATISIFSIQDLFWKADFYRERREDGKSSFICWFTPQVFAMAGAELIRGHEPGASSGTPAWLQGSQGFESSSAAFPVPK